MVEYILYKLVQFLVLVIPLRFVYWVATGMAGLGYYFCRGSKKIFKENLGNVFEDWSEEKISECVRANFVQFCKFIADFFYISKLNSSNISEFIRIENREYLEQVAAQKKGVIAVTGHIGNWEVGGVALALHGYPVSAIALSHEQARVDAIFVGQRAGKGVNVIPVGKAGRGSYRELLRGGIVAILGDRDVTSQGIRMPFFGKLALFPRGMPALAVRTGANIVPGFVIRGKDGGFTLFLEKPFRADLSRSAQESEKDVLQKWIRIFEKYIVLYPEQWFMYHRVWDKKQSR